MDADAPALAPASLVRRLCAGLIDAPLSVVPFVLFLVLLGRDLSTDRAALELGFWAAGLGEWSDARDASFGASVEIPLLALSVWIYLFACRRRWGRLLGKRRASIRVVDTSGAELTFPRAYAREIVKVVIFVAFFVVMPPAANPIIFEALAAVMCNYEPGEFHEGFCAVGAAVLSPVVAFLVIPSGVALLLWLVPFLRKDKRALHDLLTGAMVVSDAPGAKQERVDRMSADAPALAPAGALARVGATALDAAVVALPLFLLDMLPVGVVAVLWTLAYLAASIGFVGQTLGKRAFRLRVIQAGGGVSSRNRILLHETVKYASIYGALLPTSALLFPTLLGPFLLVAIVASGAMGVVLYGDSLASFALLAAFAVIPVSLLAIPVVFRKDKRALHDLLTGTMVVSDARGERPAS